MTSYSQLRSKSQSGHTRPGRVRSPINQAAPSAMGTPPPAQLQRQLGNRGTQIWLAEKATVQKVQMKSQSDEIHGPKDTEAENRTGMPDLLKAGLEQTSGMDLSDVRVHSNSPKPAQLNAFAYTQGQDIYLGPGQEKHLPHEGWHAVQQMQDRVHPTKQLKGKVNINDDEGLEKEADVMGDRAVQMKNPSQKNINPISSGIRNSGFTIQRAMKFEYQVKKNKLYRYDGKKITPLPRKYGPEDYLVKGKSGARLETETNGQIEFETSWTRSWLHLRKQIKEAVWMIDEMKKADSFSEDKNYRVFPFQKHIAHLKSGAGYKVNKKNVWAKGQYQISKINERIHSLHNKKDKLLEKKDIMASQMTKEEEKKLNKKIRKTSRDIKILERKINRLKHNKKISGLKKKRFESNPPKRSEDKVLMEDEQILIREGDPSWTAYIQYSESFELSKFKSYFDDNILLKRRGVSKKDVSFLKEKIDKSFKKIEQKEYSAKLKNFLYMISYYIKMVELEIKIRGANKEKLKKPSKYAFPLMSRTHFGSIFNSLDDKDKEIFRRMVKDNKIMKKDSPLYLSHKKRFKKTSLYKWIKGIANEKKSKDTLSVLDNQSLSAAQGAFRLEEEVGRQTGLIRFEARRTARNSQKYTNWEKHAAIRFMNAWKRSSKRKGVSLKAGNQEKNKEVNNEDKLNPFRE